MAKSFQFADFIEEFQVTFTYVEKTEGSWGPGGVWQDGEEIEREMKGIILPLNEDDLNYVEQGTYQTKDKKIYTLEPLKIGQTVRYKGDEYTVQNFRDYSDYADVYIYYARCVT